MINVKKESTRFDVWIDEKIKHPQVKDALLFVDDTFGSVSNIPYLKNGKRVQPDRCYIDDIPDYENFVHLLAENNRLTVLPFINEQFAALKAAAERRIDVTVTSAAPIDEAQREKLSKAIGAKLQQNVDVTWSVDETLVAGAIIRAGDVVIDGTVSAGLEQMRNALTQ